MFAKKGQKIIDMNMEAMLKERNYFNEQAGGSIAELQLEQADGKKRMFMIGNDAIALRCLSCWLPFYASLSNHSCFRNHGIPN